jgi:hypothetical protein
MQRQPRSRLARAYRIDGSIVLYRLAAGSPCIAECPLVRAEPWWSMVFGAALFLRTLLHLVFLCPHRHRGPPMRRRESISSNLTGSRSVYSRGTYITCLDCGQKFAYNHKTRRLVDFWGIHDAEGLAGLRRKLDGFLSPFRGLAASVGTLNMGIPVTELVRSAHRLAILTKGQWIKNRRSIASKEAPRSNLQQTQTRPEEN